MTSLRRHLEAATLAGVAAAVLLCASLLPAGGAVPAGVYGVGLVGGALSALHAAGLVVVYRANRVINFAQIQMSALGALVFAGLVQKRLLIVGLHKICPPCLGSPTSVAEVREAGPYGEAVLRAAGLADAPPSTALGNVTDAAGQPLDASALAAATAPGWLVHLTYWLSIALALAIAVGLVWALYHLVVKRFRSAPRLILTVLTLGAGQAALTVGSVVLSPLLATGSADAASLRPPIPGSLSLHPAVFTAVDLMILLSVAGAAVGLTLFFRRSSSGIGLRAAAENPDRAETLGVNLDRVTGRAWMLAGLLGGVASILATAQLGSAAPDGLGTLVRALAAAVVGGMAALPLTIAGALTIGVLDQSVLWSTGSDAMVSLLLLGLIVALLLVQRARSSRAAVEAQATWVASREVRPTPAELRKLPVVRSAARAMAALVGILVLGYPWFMSPGQTSAAMATMVAAMIGLSLLVLTGWAGQISLGQIAFAAIGGWVATVSGWPFPVALVASALAGALVALAVGIPAIRLRGLHLAISTLALGAVVTALLLDRRALGRFATEQVERPSVLGLDLDDDRAFYYVVLSLLAMTIAAIAGMRRSRSARALIASRDNEPAAQAFGIDLVRTRLGAFAISGFIAAAAGATLVYVQRGFEAQSFAPTRSIELFLMTVIGGLGSIAGPVMGAVYLGLLGLARGSVFASIAQILLSPGLGVVVLLIMMPGGLSQMVFGARDAWLRRVASRHRLHVPSLVGDTAVEGKVALAPRQQPGGGSVFVPVRYRPSEQWAIDARAGITREHARTTGGDA